MNAPAATRTGRVREVRAAHTRTSGGSSDSDENAFAANPYGLAVVDDGDRRDAGGEDAGHRAEDVGGNRGDGLEWLPVGPVLFIASHGLAW